MSRRKLLILTLYYPPMPDVGGIRYFEFAKYLPSFGWEATVATITQTSAAAGEQGVFRVPLYRWIQAAALPQPSSTGNGSQITSLRGRLLLSLRRTLQPFLVPDGLNFWADHRFASATASLHKKMHFDAVLISCGPFSLPLTAMKLKRRFGIPIVYDFRDGLTLNPYPVCSPQLEPAFDRYEEKILRSCDGLITTTPLTTAAHIEKYPFLKDHAWTINNGFDEKLFSSIPAQSKADRFTLAYTGAIDKFRSLNIIFKAFLELNFPDAQIDVFGRVSDTTILQEALHDPRIHFHGLKPRVETITRSMQSHLLLLNQGFGMKTKQCYPIAAKTYEYLRTGIPILCLAPPGDNTDLVKKYGHHSYAVTEPDETKIRAALLDAYTTWKSGAYEERIHEEFLNNFNRQTLTKRLSEVLNSVIQNHSSNRQ